MSTDIYQVNRHRRQGKRRRLIWLCLVLLVLAGGWWGWGWIRQQLKPKTTITQAVPVTTKVSYNSVTKQYTEPDFTITLPATWQPQPRQPGPYQLYTWQSSDRGSNGQLIQIFENTIPTNFAVNRALVVQGESDRVALEGSASDNCSKFTANTAAAPNQTGSLAKWQGVTFLCDQKNAERDVIGTSSADGVNTVLLQSQTTGVKRKFFFVYTDYSLNPDYTVFYNAVQSLRMK